MPASSGGSPAGAGSVALQCTVESDAWDTHSRRKWTGEAASATELLAALSARFNVSAPATMREGSLLLQWYRRCLLLLVVAMNKCNTCMTHYCTVDDAKCYCWGQYRVYNPMSH